MKALLAFVLGLLFTVEPFAQRRAPRFTDYPVRQIYKGKNAPLRLKRDDLMFRTRLRWMSKEKSNVAGHYVLRTWGCGTGCIFGAVFNVKTGEATFFPSSFCCWSYDIPEDFEPVEIRLDSSLIIFHGAPNENLADHGVHYYRLLNNRFTLIRSIKSPRKGPFETQ